MKQVTIGVFHDDSLASDLGKKATESDMVFFHRKTDDTVFSFIIAVDDKISVKSQIMNMIDMAIVSAQHISTALGETMLMLDSLQLKTGLFIVPPYTDTAQLKKMMKDTSVESFEIMDRNVHQIMDYLSQQEVAQESDASVAVTIDHFFPVKGVGEVILGFVSQGVVHKHDKLTLLPFDKEVIVRSIQMQDHDVNEASAGSRVGLAVRGITVDELKRGYLLCSPDAAGVDTEFRLPFMKNPFYPEVRMGRFHATIGLQTVPVQITDFDGEKISISFEKPVCFIPGQSVIILDLNASKLHHMGTAMIA